MENIDICPRKKVIKETKEHTIILGLLIKD
jgi:hypothetical protein